MRLRFAISFRPCLRPLAVLLTVAMMATCTAKVYAVDKKSKLPKESRRSETREIEALEKQWRAALVTGNTLLLDKLLSDDFLAISARGTLSDKQQYLHHIASQATQFSAFDLMDIKVHVQPRLAVAVSQAHIQGLLEGRPIEGTFRYTKVYIRTSNGVWRMTNFEATRVSSRTANTSGMDEGLPLGEDQQNAPR